MRCNNRSPARVDIFVRSRSGPAGIQKILPAPPPADFQPRDGADKKFVSAVRTASAASVRTTTALDVLFPVHVRTAPQSPKLTPQEQLPFAPPDLKHCVPHNILLWV